MDDMRHHADETGRYERQAAIAIPLVLVHTGTHGPAPAYSPLPAFHHLVEDLEEAIGVYELMAAGAPSSSARHPQSFFASTLELAAEDLLDEGTEAHTIAHTLTEMHAQSNMPIYALAITPGPHTDEAECALERVAAMCREHDIPWGGGLAFGEAELIARCARQPRMGRMRRARSEHIDLLIAAIRSRCGMHSLPDAPSSGIVRVPRSVPRIVYPLVAWALMSTGA